jgi:hypothetical protein
VIVYNEWKTEKRHECTNMGKLKLLELWWRLYVTWLPERDFRNIRPLDFCWTECTSYVILYTRTSFTYSSSYRKIWRRFYTFFVNLMKVKNTSRELCLAALLLASVYMDIIPEKRNKINFTNRWHLNDCCQNFSINSIWIFQRNACNLKQNCYTTPERVNFS